MMRTLKRSLIFLAITIAGFLLPGLSGFAAGLRFVPMANAETKIGGRISSQSWTKENSPYKLTADVFIPANETLNIGPGAVVEPDDSDPNASIILDPGANLYIDGQPDDRAVIGRLGHIYALQGNVRISYADMSTQGIDLQLYSSTADISSSTFIRSTGTAIYVSQSRVAIRDSRIEDNQYAGVIALPSKMSSYIDIHDSIIARNGIGIQNSGGSTVHAENVWWGDSSGPALVGQNRVIGSVAYSPWLTAEPPLAFDPPKPVCCSSVLFIPGIEGSRLYKDQSAFGVATATMKMWEPATDLSLASLRMNADGSSADPAIYSGDPLGSAYGLKDIYGGFMASLGSLVEHGIINEWRPFGYDWRRPIADIVSGPEKKATTTESLIGIVEQMAAASKTGKVSIVAHSNGGLVAKALVKALDDAGRSSLIDTVVSVAVPYLGTPQAIAALLHGDSQAILGGLLMSQKAARDLSQNMASAYSLLPSAAYFAQAVSPSIAFASTSIEGLGNEAYPAKIADAADQSGFIADSAGTRAQPSYSEVDRPTKGNSLLLNAANALHAALDAFVWPASISRWAVVGWDQPTTKAVQYFQGLSCSIKLFRPWCAPAVKYETKKTLGGDGVVVSASASHDAGQGISIDLSAVSGQEGRYVDHVSMLGASTTQGVIARILSAPSSSGDKVRADLSGLPGVSITGPSVLPSPEYLVVKTHSPVELHVYDDMGRHTGFISKPAALDGNSSIAAAYETGIPGSSFEAHEETSDGMMDGWASTIRLPEDPGHPYSVVMNGTDLGFATLDIERANEDGALDSVEYSMFPVTPLVVATTDFDYQAGKTLASSTLPLAIDMDGDGTADRSVDPDPGHIPADEEGIEAVRSLVAALAGPDPHANQLLQRIDHIAQLAAAGKLKQAEKQGASFKSGVGHLKLKDITQSDRQKILDLVGSMVSDVEQAQS